MKYFEVNPESGEITLVREVPRDKARFQFSVVANDNGWPEPQMVVVQAVIRVHDRQQNAPQWQNNPVECPQQVIVSEDIQKNTVILKCFAMSGEDRSRPISYKLSNSANNFDKNNKQTFREFVEKNDAGFAYVIVRNMGIDYK